MNIIKVSLLFVIFTSFALLCMNVQGFALSNGKRIVGKSLVVLKASNDWSGSSTGGSGQGRLVELKYKIYPGGRVEELVQGVKGGNCHKVTEDIEAALGDVVATDPTEEMYENEIEIKTETQVKNGNSWEDSGSGFSSW